jgi:hypothetical protein
MRELNGDDAYWQSMYSKLSFYKMVNGHTNVERFGSLAIWLSKQRGLYKRKELAEDRRIRLEALGVSLEAPNSKRIKDQFWMKKLEMFKAFLEKSGGVYPKKKSQDPVEVTLARWVGVQRQAAQHLDEKRRQLLDEIEFVWMSHDHVWLKNFEAFKKYRADYNGAYPSSHSRTPRIEKLGRWVVLQRESKDTMPAERRRLLNEENFVWDRNTLWFECFDRFIDFIEINDGKYPAIRSKNPDEVWIANWVKRQRVGIGMNDERRKALDSVGFVWRAARDDWEQVEQSSEILERSMV